MRDQRNLPESVSHKYVDRLEIGVIVSPKVHVGHSPVIVGYARTSSLSQVAGLEAQERELTAAGCEKIFSEQVSSLAERDQLEQALDYVRDGDVFTVTKLDRLARSVSDLLTIIGRLEAKKVGLRILSMSGN